MNYYIATNLENHEQHNALRDVLYAAGHKCTYDWTVHGPVYSQGLRRVEEVSQLEHQGVVDADTVIVLWPGGRGTHVELGMAIALEKRCIIISDVAGHHEACADTCAFYHHPHVRLFKTVIEFLRGELPNERQQWINEAARLLAEKCGDKEPNKNLQEWAESMAESYYDEVPGDFTAEAAVDEELSCL